MFLATKFLISESFAALPPVTEQSRAVQMVPTARFNCSSSFLVAAGGIQMSCKFRSHCETQKNKNKFQRSLSQRHFPVILNVAVSNMINHPVQYDQTGDNDDD